MHKNTLTPCFATSIPQERQPGIEKYALATQKGSPERHFVLPDQPETNLQKSISSNNAESKTSHNQ